MSKSDGNTVLMRVGEIAVMLLDGHSRNEIVQYVSEKWNVGERMADNYIKKAKENISSSVKQDLQYDYSKAVRRYEFLYKKAIEKKDYKIAISVVKEMSMLEGLLKKQVEHTGEIQFISSVPE